MSTAAGLPKPRVDQSLEPIKALLEKRSPAVVRASRAPAIEAVIKWFDEQKLPYVLQGVDDAVQVPEILRPKTNVILGPDAVQRIGTNISNVASTLSEQGAVIALGSMACGGTRYLPLHAAYLVRYGLDPNEALNALTIHPARMFLLDDRVGSLKRGKDADFVVFSGNPFEMASRVQLVVIGGRVVIDRRPNAKRSG